MVDNSIPAAQWMTTWDASEFFDSSLMTTKILDTNSVGRDFGHNCSSASHISAPACPKCKFRSFRRARRRCQWANARHTYLLQVVATLGGNLRAKNMGSRLMKCADDPFARMVVSVATCH